MKCRVYEITTVSGETLGFGKGCVLDEDGEPTGQDVSFVGDWRPMHNLRESLAMLESGDMDLLPVVTLEPWQVRQTWTECPVCGGTGREAGRLCGACLGKGSFHPVQKLADDEIAPF